MSERPILALSPEELQEPFSVNASGTVVTIRDYVLSYGHPDVLALIVDAPDGPIFPPVKQVANLTPDELKTIALNRLVGLPASHPVDVAGFKTTKGELADNLERGIGLGPRFCNILAGRQIVLHEAITSGRAPFSNPPQEIRPADDLLGITAD